MKKILFIAATVVAGMALTSCGSSKESVYRKAYEKAKAQEQVQPTTQPVQQPVAEQSATPATPVVTPLVEAPATQQVTAQNNVPVRSEKVNVVQGNGLKAYSVIVGSFGVRANAENMLNTLKSQGKPAQLAVNPETNMYRVVYDTFDTRDDAARCKQSIASTYNGAWLLLKK